MSNPTFRKQVIRPADVYSPVKAVTEYGDLWVAFAKGPSAATALALKERTSDQDDLFTMTLMEKGVIGRIQL